MDKQTFLAQLREGLSGLPQGEIAERLSFYHEMIDDRMEEGLSETEAVAAVGSVEGILSQIRAEIPPADPRPERSKPKQPRKAWEILLIALGAPIWLPLLIAACAVVLSLYAVLWSVVVSLWAVFGSLTGCAFGGLAASLSCFLGGNVLAGIAMAGAGLVCAGVSIFLFFGCKTATKGAVLLAKKIVSGIWKCFTKREEA